MAYSQSPSQSTYQTKSFNFVNELNNRTGNTDKDLDFLNCFFEAGQSKLSGEKHIEVMKRAGLLNYISLPGIGVRGMYYWEDLNQILVAIGNTVYMYNSDTGALLYTLAAIFGTTTGEVGFSEFLYDDNTTRIVITDGNTLGTVTSVGVWLAGTDPDMPVPHLPQPIFLDGYLFIVKAGTADIYNSDLNNPTSYVAGDFISCEMFPDTVTKIVKLNNYILAFGSSSIEYFWDAANESGSPLQRNDTPVKLVGYLGGLAQSGNRLYFVGATSTATPEVFMIEDFKIQPISNETVRRYLASLSDTLVANIGNITSFLGHDFYVLNVGTTTYVLDLQTQSWTRWGYQQSVSFPLEQSMSVKSNTTYTSAVFINGTSNIMKFNHNTYQDVGVNFTTTITTKREAFDTYNQKFMARLIINGDRPATDAFLSVSWTDDDYQTYNTPQTLNLNQELPCLYRLGRFRRRAFKFSFTSNHPLRLVHADVDINLGQA